MDTGLLLILAAIAAVAVILRLRKRNKTASAEREWEREQRQRQQERTPTSARLSRDGFSVSLTVNDDLYDDDDFEGDDFDDDDYDDIKPKARRGRDKDRLPLFDYPFHMRYQDANGAITEREVTAYGVRQKNENLYLYGYCHERGAFRTFRIERIMELVDLSTGEVVPEPKSHLLAAAWEVHQNRR